MLILNSVRGFDAQLLGQGHLILVNIYSKFISFSWGEKNRKEMNDLERFLIQTLNNGVVHWTKRE